MLACDEATHVNALSLMDAVYRRMYQIIHAAGMPMTA